MSTKQEYIAEADRLLVQAGVPTYSDLMDQKRQLVWALRVAKQRFETISDHTNVRAIDEALTSVGVA